MSTQQNTITPISIWAPFPAEGEFVINARLLYLYLGHPMLRYEDWAEPLPSQVASRAYPRHFKLFTGADGELALNFEFAMYFAAREHMDLRTAIALALLCEGRLAASQGDPGYANRWLKEFDILALGGGHMHAEGLHRFLGIEQSYDDWVTWIKDKYRMAYRKDYLRVTYSAPAPPVLHKKDSGKGEVIFGARIALTVAAETPTTRGKAIRLYQRKSSAGRGVDF